MPLRGFPYYNIKLADPFFISRLIYFRRVKPTPFQNSRIRSSAGKQKLVMVSDHATLLWQAPVAAREPEQGFSCGLRTGGLRADGSVWRCRAECRRPAGLGSVAARLQMPGWIRGPFPSRCSATHGPSLILLSSAGLLPPPRCPQEASLQG